MVLHKLPAIYLDYNTIHAALLCSAFITKSIDCIRARFLHRRRVSDGTKLETAGIQDHTCSSRRRHRRSATMVRASDGAAADNCECSAKGASPATGGGGGAAASRNDGSALPRRARESIPLPTFPYRHSSNKAIPTVSTHPIAHPPLTTSPSGASLAFTALQFLPTPLMVLSRDKTVVLANEAMGRLLGMEPPTHAGNRLVAAHREPSQPSITELLYGKSLGDLGVNILQKSPLMVNWELFLDALAKDMSGDEDGFASANALIGVAGNGASPTSDAPPILRGHPVRDVALDVYFNNIEEIEYPGGGSSPPLHIQAKMIVSIWILDSERHFTLAFTSTTPPPPPPPDGSFNPGVSTVHAGPDRNRLGTALLPMGAPASTDISITPSVLERVLRMKDAALDAMEIPVFGFWHDGSVGFFNRAAQELSHAKPGTYTFRYDDLPKWFKVWSEDFARELDVNEHPMFKLLKTREEIKSERFGMYSPTGKRLVLDSRGDGIYDDATGEFLGGLLWLRDVTDFQEKLVTQAETNELRFMTMCDCMPQLVRGSFFFLHVPSP